MEKFACEKKTQIKIENKKTRSGRKLRVFF